MAHSENHQSNRLGDFLLSFGSHPAYPFPARTSTARRKILNHHPGWQLWATESSPAWHGFPVKTFQTNTWQCWFLGKCYPPSHNFLAQNWLPQSLENFQQKIPSTNGRFLILIWDHHRRQWHIWTDRFGTLHAYHAFNGNRAAIGTFFPSVAAVASQRKLDWSGLSGFFAFGFFPQDLTYFQDVRILRPATHYTFDENGQLIEEKRYWHWRHQPDDQRSYKETVDQYAQIFAQVMRDHLGKDRTALPISGGLDSRSTVAAVNSTNTENLLDNIWAYSYGYSPDSMETSIASRVAKARSLSFSAFTIQPYLFDNIEKILSWTEGFQDITQPRQASVRDQIATHADQLIAALWGDVWHDQMGFPVHQEWDERNIASFALHKMEKSGRKWLLDHLARPQFQDHIENLLMKIVAGELKPLAHIQDPDFRIKAFKTEQWSFRWSIPPIRVFQSAAWPQLVFYDHRLADFFCTVPTAFVANRRLQIDHLKQYAPDLAHVPWQVYDTSLYRYQYFNSWLIPKRAAKKAWRILTRKKIIERNWEVQFLNETGRKGLIHWLLRPGLRLHEFVSPSSIRELLDDFFTAPLAQGRGYTTSMLLTFSAWLEIYG